MIFYYLGNFSGLKKMFFVMNAYATCRYVQKTLFISLCFLFVFNTQESKGQDAVFSQYYSSYLYLNPAFAAAEPTVTAGFNSRVQWKSVTTPYTTNQASLIIPIYKSTEKFQNIGGIGLSVYNNKAGQVGLNTVGANLNAAYVISLNQNNQILTGIQVGFIQKTIDFSQGQWGSQYNPLIGFDVTQVSGYNNGFVSTVLYPDVGAGLLYYNKPRREITEKGKSFYFGFSAYHLNRPNESVIKSQASPLPILYKATFGGEFSINSSWNISPNLLIAKQNAALQINVGTYVTYSFGSSSESMLPTKLIAGAWYRLNDSGIGSIGIGNRFYMIGFSYDMNSSTLRLNTDAKSAGAYEISLKISTPKVVKTQRVYQTPRI